MQMQQLSLFNSCSVVYVVQNNCVMTDPSAHNRSEELNQIVSFVQMKTDETQSVHCIVF